MKKLLSLLIATGLLFAHMPIESGQYWQRSKQAAQKATQSSQQFVSDLFTKLGDAMSKENRQQVVPRILEQAKAQARPIGGVVLAAVIAGITVALTRYLKSPEGALRVEAVREAARKYKRPTLAQAFDRYNIPEDEITAYILAIANADNLNRLFEQQPIYKTKYIKLIERYPRFKDALAEVRGVTVDQLPDVSTP